MRSEAGRAGPGFHDAVFRRILQVLHQEKGDRNAKIWGFERSLEGVFDAPFVSVATPAKLLHLSCQICGF